MRPLLLLTESIDRLRIFQQVIEDLGLGLAALNDAQDAAFRHIAFVLAMELDTLAKIGELLEPTKRIRSRGLASLQFTLSPVHEIVATAMLGLEPAGGERTIARGYVARVAIELLKDRFTDDAALASWLQARGIESLQWPT
jgi:hypothetical protein